MDKPSSVDSYLSGFSGDIRKSLDSIRAVVRDAAPEAVESISYGMPGYKLNGKPLVYFAGFPHHIGFYATPEGNSVFTKELSQYKQGKGSVQFPIDNPPLDLIRRMVEFKVSQTKRSS